MASKAIADFVRAPEAISKLNLVAVSSPPSVNKIYDIKNTQN